MNPVSSFRRLDVEGFAIISGALNGDDTLRLRQEVETALGPNSGAESVRHRDGQVYAARNVLAICPAARTAWRHPAVVELLTQVLGESFGLVRGLYFDKPPGQSWALPWHKDLCIAVRPPRGASEAYSPVRLKMGVPHCEPPLEVLESMLTLRIHLDDVTDENGPLEVLPGTHRTGKVLQVAQFSPRRILAEAGDVLAMRPLLAHASSRSKVGTTRHRRVLHLEFSGRPSLPDGYEWNEFYSSG